MTRILGIIPARAGSKRLPRKNKLPFQGKPLIKHIIESACKASLLDQLVVNTDDLEILSYKDEFPSVKFLARPKSISGDDAAAIAYVQHTLRELETVDSHFDIVVILQPTSPLTLPEDIDSTIQTLLDSKADSAVSVVKLDHATHPVKMKTLNGNILEPYLEEENGRMAEKDLPEIYVRNCSVYVSKRSVIAEGRIIGDKCLAYVMPRERSVDINDSMDFAFAEFLKLRLS